MFCPKCAGTPSGKCSLHSNEPNMIYFGGKFDIPKKSSHDAFKDYFNKLYGQYNIANAYPPRMINEDVCLECGSTNLIDLQVEWFFRLIAWLNKATVIALGCNELDCKTSHLVFKLKDKYVGGK